MAQLNYPSDLKYARTDEWVRLEGDIATIGISDFAQDQLNDVVFVELPEVGTEVKKGEPFGTVESVKAASDLNAPVTGTVTEVNDAVRDNPELINSDPYERGWLIKVKVSDPDSLNDLMDSAAYAKYNEPRM
ncbi:MAG: glycine cleavage system protein GcvH [Chloroflexota bacterium]|nr:MAG: glycine cleavage system protein GcvH [Chloroflexota bacterium]